MFMFGVGERERKYFKGTYWSKVHDQLGIELASCTLLVMDIFSGTDVQPENTNVVRISKRKPPSNWRTLFRYERVITSRRMALCWNSQTRCHSRGAGCARSDGVGQSN